MSIRNLIALILVVFGFVIIFHGFFCVLYYVTLNDYIEQILIGGYFVVAAILIHK